MPTAIQEANKLAQRKPKKPTVATQLSIEMYREYVFRLVKDKKNSSDWLREAIAEKLQKGEK